MRRLWKWFFDRPEDEMTVWGVIRWLETRRIAYNIFIGAAGIISFILFLIFIEKAHVLEPGEDAVEPLALFAAPILMNICYTGGEIVELVWRALLGYNAKVGSVLLKLGVAFSLSLVALPSVFWGGALLLSIFFGSPH